MRPFFGHGQFLAKVWDQCAGRQGAEGHFKIETMEDKCIAVKTENICDGPSNVNCET